MEKRLQELFVEWARLVEEARAQHGRYCERIEPKPVYDWIKIVQTVTAGGD